VNGERPAPSAERARSFGALAHAVLVFLAVYLPLEEFLLKWVPLDPTGTAILRLGGEVLLYGALAGVVVAYKLRGLALPRSPIDRPLAAFAAVALLSLVLSGGSWLAGLVNLRVLLRYAAAYFLAVYLVLERGERRRLLRLLVLGAALQGVLGVVQYASGGASEFWLPRYSDLELAGIQREFTALTGGLERGAVVGTAAHSVAFALVLLAGGLLALALALARRRGTAGLVTVGALCGVGIYFSYSRATLLVYALGAAALLFLMRRTFPVARAFGIALVLGLPLGALALLVGPTTLGGATQGFVKEKEVAVSPLESLGQLLSEQYLEHAQVSRLWILRDVGSEVVKGAGLVGFGPDEEHAKEQVQVAGGAGLARLVAYKAFEDVYWVALLAYYGFLGLALFAAVLWKLAASARALLRAAVDEAELALGAAALALVLVVVPLSFLVRTFEFRAFAFDFWLVAGVVACALSGARGRGGVSSTSGARPG